MGKITVDVDITRNQIREMFRKWGIDRSETEILWEESKDGRRLPGAVVRYMRSGKWQEVSCHIFNTRVANLRQIYLLLDRLRIAEDNGVAYAGLSGSKKLVPAGTNNETSRKESLLDAYDVLGASPDDPVELIKDIYRRKSNYYHPDHGGNAERFKRLTDAYNFIMKERGLE